MATAVCGSAHRAAPDQFRGCGEIRRVVGQSPLPTKPISEPDNPLRDDALEDADQPRRSCLKLTPMGSRRIPIRRYCRWLSNNANLVARRDFDFQFSTIQVDFSAEIYRLAIEAVEPALISDCLQGFDVTGD